MSPGSRDVNEGRHLTTKRRRSPSGRSIPTLKGGADGDRGSGRAGKPTLHASDPSGLKLPERTMLNLAFSLRYIMFVASLGAAMGALVMLWEGCLKLFVAFRVLGATGDEAGTVIGFVIGATDEFLFALVLLIFAYAIAFGFVI